MAPGESDGRVRMVCFDWGGVILRIVRSWSEACGRAGLDVRAGSESSAGVAARRPISSAYQEGRCTSAEFFDRLSASMDGLYSPTELSRIHDAWLIEEYRGIDRLVDRLLATPGVETGLLSNTNHDHWERQAPVAGKAHFPTAGRLRHKHASHLLGLAKPGLEIYRAFERLTGCAGTQILFFDDLADNIASARAVGWRAEQVDHAGDTSAQIEAALRSHGVL